MGGSSGKDKRHRSRQQKKPWQKHKTTYLTSVNSSVAFTNSTRTNGLNDSTNLSSTTSSNRPSRSSSSNMSNRPNRSNRPNSTSSTDSSNSTSSTNSSSSTRSPKRANAPSSTNAFTQASNSNTIAEIGGWVEAAGNIVAAIGSTPTNRLSDSMQTDLNIIGNALQAVGSVLSINNGAITLDELGDILQSVGNVTVIAGILNQNETASERLEMVGNELQLVGSGLSLDLQDNLTFSQSLDNIGNIIQIIGVTMQIYANPNTEEGFRRTPLAAGRRQLAQSSQHLHQTITIRCFFHEYRFKSHQK